jgi:hypothetical protein
LLLARPNHIINLNKCRTKASAIAHRTKAFSQNPSPHASRRLRVHSDHSAVEALLEHGGLQREPRFKQWQCCLLDGVLRAGLPSGEQGEDCHGRSEINQSLLALVRHTQHHSHINHDGEKAKAR